MARSFARGLFIVDCERADTAFTGVTLSVEMRGSQIYVPEWCPWLLMRATHFPDYQSSANQIVVVATQKIFQQSIRQR
jgi:hypothetical protein